jgi:hypothetical protein
MLHFNLFEFQQLIPYVCPDCPIFSKIRTSKPPTILFVLNINGRLFPPAERFFLFVVGTHVQFVFFFVAESVI